MRPDPFPLSFRASLNFNHSIRGRCLIDLSLVNCGLPRFHLRAWRWRSVLAPLDASMEGLVKDHGRCLDFRLSVFG